MAPKHIAGVMGTFGEVMRPDGTMARLPELRRVAAEHALTLISIADLIDYRRRSERLIRKVAEAATPGFPDG